MHVAKLGLEGSIRSFFYGDGTYCCTFGGFWSKSCIYFLLIVEVETSIPSKAIFDVFAHLTSVPTWDKWVVLD
jgi:hypothetical protein